MKVIVYYVFKNGEKIYNSGFFEMDDAIEYAKEINADEVEAAIWYSGDSFNNYEFADEFKTVWEKQGE